jgi:uncharacterized membrane protein
MAIRLARALDTVAAKIEHATWLDPAADTVAGLVRRVLPRGPVRDIASGTPLAHPVHPALVAIPVGSWSAATYLDLIGGKRHQQAARQLVGLGNLAALPTAITGANDWAYTQGAERRVGFVHALLNDVALSLFVGSWWVRRRGHALEGIALSLAGSGVLSAGAWLGGHLAYALGVGVDTTSCPWHGSRFCVDDGAVVEGPATRPAPVFETRVTAGRVEVRRDQEPRSLRTDPVGV